MYSYADDNTLKVTANDACEVKKILIKESIKAVTWFEMNLMEADPDKFQFMQTGTRLFPERSL